MLFMIQTFSKVYVFENAACKVMTISIPWPIWWMFLSQYLDFSKPVVSKPKRCSVYRVDKSWSEQYANVQYKSHVSLAIFTVLAHAK